MAETFRFEPADQAAQRRAQLTRVVAHLVVTRGVDAVSHASVAELAGCARSLVYRYFPQRADLLYSLLATFEAELNERFSFEDVLAGVVALKDVRPGHVPGTRQDFVDRLWTADDWAHPAIEFRLACVILMRDSSLNTVLGAHEVELQESMQRRLIGPLEGLGLSRIEAWIVVDSMLSVMHHATQAVRAGEATPEEAVELLLSVSSRVLQTFTDERG
ncbi:MAG TPA: TetR/AcrR family transcriptional regulator [Acidimicrobiia bacterium]